MSQSRAITARIAGRRTACVLLAGVCALKWNAPAVAQDVQFLRDVARRLNVERMRHGLKPLTYDKTLEKAAQAHAEWMARNQKMEHLEESPRSLDEQRTCNEHPANRVVNAGYFRWDDLFTVEARADGAVVHPTPAANGAVGEIIAKGANAGHPAMQPATIVPGWMNSPGHRKTILTPTFQEFGIGTACIGNDTYWCVVFGKPNR
jgi:uncharacterized protein YkwD